MELVILHTVFLHGLSTESSIVWVKHSVEHLILYGKPHVNLYLSRLIYFRMVWFFFLFLFLFSFSFPFFFFFDGVTLNPNITKQERYCLFCKKSSAFIGSDNHVQILSMPSSAGVKSLSCISTPCKIYSHRNYHFFSFCFYWEYTRVEPSTFSWWFLTSPVLTYRYKRHFRTSRET